jgi:hypothetical protein
MNPDRGPDGRLLPGHKHVLGSGRPNKFRALARLIEMGGERGAQQGMAILASPLCRQCGLPMVLTGWKARRSFCSPGCHNAWVRARRAPSKLKAIAVRAARKQAQALIRRCGWGDFHTRRERHFKFENPTGIAGRI